MCCQQTLACHGQQRAFANAGVTIENKRRFTPALPTLNGRVDVRKFFIKSKEQSFICEGGKIEMPQVLRGESTLKDAVQAGVIEGTQQFAGRGFEQP